MLYLLAKQQMKAADCCRVSTSNAESKQGNMGHQLPQSSISLYYFTKGRKKHNTTCLIILPSLTFSPSLSSYILAVILNKRLSWQHHLQQIKSKLATQKNV